METEPWLEEILDIEWDEYQEGEEYEEDIIDEWDEEE